MKSPCFPFLIQRLTEFLHSFLILICNQHITRKVSRLEVMWKEKSKDLILLLAPYYLFLELNPCR